MSLDQQIDQWRSYLRRRQAIHSVDVAELEDHLREQIARLRNAGLAADEAFLVAVKRMGSLDALSQEFALEHSDRLWKQFVIPSESDEPRSEGRRNALVAFVVAAMAAAAVKLPALFGMPMSDGNEGFYFRNASPMVLPFLTGYFAWRRGLSPRTWGWLAAAFVVAAIFCNVYPMAPGGRTEVLTGVHLPIALWLIVGVAYAGGRWRDPQARMNFIRFSGELFIYYVLIALGGGVLTAFFTLLFTTIGLEPEFFIQHWLVPCGAAGAVVVASWLVEAKQSVIENMAPVLTRLFTPLFGILLVTFLVMLALTGRGPNMERDLLIAFDLLLVVVLGLLLYSISSRDPALPPGPFDFALVALVISALLVDAVALWAIAARITEFGFTPNRVAALGENLILMVNLAWSAVLYLRFLSRRGPFTSLEKWQTDYLPVYGIWAALVVILFPPLFGYI